MTTEVVRTDKAALSELFAVPAAILMALTGLIVLIAARDGAMAFHATLVMLAGVAALVWLARRFALGQPGNMRRATMNRWSRPESSSRGERVYQGDHRSQI